MDRSDRLTILALALIFMIPFSVFGYQAMMIKPQPVYEYTQDGIHYSAYVQMIARHADGTIFATSYDHNLLTTLGKNLIKTLLSSSSSTGVNLVHFIQITNVTFTAAVTSTYCCGGSDKVVVNYGLDPNDSTYASTGDGTWTVTTTFTYDGTGGTQTIYGAALTTSVTTGGAAANNFAEALFSTTAPLSANGDNVQVRVPQSIETMMNNIIGNCGNGHGLKWSLSVS